MPEWIQTLTVDASHNASTDVTGIAIIVRQRVGRKGRGPIIEEVAEGFSNVTRGAGELLAIYRALEIAQQRGYVRIKVRSDGNAMRHKLRDDFRAGRSDTGLRGSVLLLARTFEWFDFGYVPRRKNHIAHSLARHARNLTAQAWTEPFV
jgi:ribonuclease HI